MPPCPRKGNTTDDLGSPRRQVDHELGVADLMGLIKLAEPEHRHGHSLPFMAGEQREVQEPRDRSTGPQTPWLQKSAASTRTPGQPASAGRTEALLSDLRCTGIVLAEDDLVGGEWMRAFGGVVGDS